jgi:hypothetical protein
MDLEEFKRWFDLMCTVILRTKLHMRQNEQRLFYPYIWSSGASGHFVFYFSTFSFQ